MADKIELQKFTDYFTKKSPPPKGSNEPPRTVPAKTLDKNFEKVTVVNQTEATAGYRSDYRVDYTEKGTELIFEAAEFDVCENGQPTVWRVLAQKKQ